MYTIHVDGKLLYKTGAENEAQTALNVKPSLDIESSGSLSFVLPPGNSQYDAIRMMKSIITMHQKDKMIFRGRVTETERDIFGQKDVYCEGDKSFLLDSLWEEQIWTGKVQAFFRHLIDNHNDQVETDKRFTVGIITAVDAEVPYEAEFRVETRRFWDTSTVIDERLLGVYGGYIRTRTEGGKTYIDWLSEFGEDSGQAIKFSVNMLDLKDKLDAGDVFTHLIPLGYSEIGEDGTYEAPVNISSVNGGLDYIVDEEAYAKYGKIWRSKTWGNTKDPAQLKTKAWEYMKNGGDMRTLTLKAVDMHFIDGNISMLTIGKKVLIESDPHGISLKMVLAKMEPDPDNPENSTYTFGVKPRTLSEAVIRTEKETDKLSGKSGRGGGGGGKSIQEEAQDILRWARIVVDEANANINLNAGEINNLTGRMNTAEINIDGANANINLNASAIDKVTGRVSKAEIEIDGLNSEITLKADKVTIDAELTTIKKYFAGSATAARMVVTNLTAVSATIGGNKCSWKSQEVVTGVSVSGHKSGAMVRLSDGDSYYLEYVSSVSRSVDTDTIYYMSWA